MGTASPKDVTYYQSIIGSLLYLALGTRPDIAFAVIKLAQQSANPTKEHIDKALRVLRYLQGTLDFVIEYNANGNAKIKGYCDSDFSSDAYRQRRSHSGHYFALAGAVIQWISNEQKTVAQSTPEAEYMATADCGKMACWFFNLFTEMRQPNQTPIQIHVDNTGAIFNAQNPVVEGRTKHIDIKYHAIRDIIAQGKVELIHVGTNDNPADMLTKNLSKDKIAKFITLMGLRKVQ